MTAHPPLIDDQLISQAAQKIIAGGLYRATCEEMGINLDTNGAYLGCTGNDYKRLQKAVRKLRQKGVTQILQKATGKRKKLTQHSVMKVGIMCGCIIIHHVNLYVLHIMHARTNTDTHT